MRILRLRFTNINSLRGQFEIDFTRPPLSETGLFAITGPTGSGKSTVLDALTLALYGRSARYGNTANPAEVMSRHTGECFAEVEFACAKGEYRSRWDLRRARGGAGGKLQQPQRRVMALPSGEVLTQKLDESNRLVVELTGLDYERLLRSVLLAQGDFAAFLKAKPVERTELLEKVTGTTMYSEISIAAYREAEQARNAWESLRSRAEGLAVLDSEARQEKESALAAAGARLEESRQEIEGLGKRLADATALAECERREAEIGELEAGLRGEREQSAAVLAGLVRHEQAAPLAGALGELDTLRDQQEKDQAKLAELRQELPLLSLALDAATAAMEMAARMAAEAEREDQILRPLLEEVTRLDAEVEHLKGDVAKHDAATTAARKRCEELGREIAGKGGDCAIATTRRAQLLAWLTERAPDRGIANALADIQTAAASWRNHRDQWQSWIAEHEKQCASQRLWIDEVAAVTPVIAGLQAQVEESSAALAAAQASLTAACQGQSIAEWEQQRHELDPVLARQERLQLLAENHQKAVKESGTLSEEKQRRLAEITLTVEQASLRAATLQDKRELVVSIRKRLEFAQSVQSQDERRHSLEPGAPCPLCGSLDHPYASEHDLPSKEIAAVTDELEVAETRQRTAAEAFHESERHAAILHMAQRKTDVDLTLKREAIGRMSREWETEAAAAGVTHGPERADLLDQAIAELRGRRDGMRALLLRLRDLETNVVNIGRVEQERRMALVRQSANKQTLEERVATVRQTLVEIGQRRDASEAAARDQAATVGGALAPFAEKAADPAAAEGAVRRLKKRAEEFARRTGTADKAAQEIAQLETEVAGLRKQAAAASAELEQALLQQQQVGQRLAKVQEARREKFGDKTVAGERERSQQSITRLRHAAQTVTSEKLTTERKRDACQQLRDLQIQTLDARTSLIAARTRDLAAALSGAGFATMQDLRTSLLPSAEAEKRAALRKALDDRRLTLGVRRQEVAATRAALPDPAGDDCRILPELQRRRDELQAAFPGASEQCWALKRELQQDDARRQLTAALTDEIAAAQLERDRWARLNTLIGSATGAAFSRFAQGLTLERLVALGNGHLHHLNPRYSLRRSLDDPEDLELQIVDHYQAGVLRSMQSLSGGESFLASLALALGLSDLASGRKSIESLFIDEGFGTLDAETLETAMAALEQLQAKGKTIGVISHIEAMKERIPVQIRLSKREGGWSALEVEG